MVSRGEIYLVFGVVKNKEITSKSERKIKFKRVNCLKNKSNTIPNK